MKKALVWVLNYRFVISIILIIPNIFQSQTKKEIYEKYLNNGAYKYSYFHPKYQQYLDSALVYLPKDAFLWQQKAMPLFKRKKYELGMTYLDNVVKNDDEYDSMLSYRAFIKCIFQKDYSGAIADLDVLIKKYPKGIIMDHSYVFYKALSQIQLNQYQEAENNLKISTNLFIQNGIESHFLEIFYLGITFYERENYNEAIKYFDESLKQNPKFSDCQYYKALSLYYLNRKPEALEIIKKAEENFLNGDTITEDNRFYEDYPYQIKKWMLENLVGLLDAK